MDQVKIQCCLCGSLTHYNQSKMCITCLQSRVNITESIQKDIDIQICRYCERYNRPPWLPAKLESSELLSICLHKVKGLTKCKIMDSGFVWTEPHSKRIHVKIKVQQEVESVLMEQECIVKFIVQDTQCDDCKKTFTPHTWTAKVQIRQKADHTRTLFYLEQLILKNNANKDFMAVKQKNHGFDVHFSLKSHAKRFVDFVNTQVPTRVNDSKQLISSDFKSNTYNYKYTYIVEIASICKEDLIILPYKYKVPGLGKVLLCTRITNQIHVIDVLSFQSAEIKNSQYWKNPFEAYASKSRLVEFVVLDIERAENGTFELEVAKNNNERFAETTYKVKSLVGKGVNCGDIVLGYDFTTIVPHHWEEKVLNSMPEVIIVNRPQTKTIKVKRLVGSDAELTDPDDLQEPAENIAIN